MRQGITRKKSEAKPAPKLITATAPQITAAFTEMERRYRANPSEYTAEAERLLVLSIEYCGQANAASFIEALKEVKRKGAK